MLGARINRNAYALSQKYLREDSMAKSALTLRLEQRKKAITDSTNSIAINNDIPNVRKLRLASGKIVELELHIFDGKCNIEQSTTVDSSNIRDQEQLTTDSLRDILASIADVQLYPAIGYLDDNVVKIVDGSRRRKAAIIKDCQYLVEVASCTLSLKDAEEIVRISEQKKKLSYFEWGRFYTAKLEHGFYSDAKSMAEAEGISTGYLSLCLNAAKIPSDILSIFIDSSLVASQKNTQLLIDLVKTIEQIDMSLESFLDGIDSDLNLALERACTPEEHTELVLETLRVARDKLKHKKKNVNKEKIKVENLGGGVTFSIKSKDSSVINLRKVPEDKKNKIKEFIRELME
jgi:ParB family chromosome partitioning protein